eukprot:CAMPEP_0115005166 /NCGR_PEP_ID=MMETSP0216-20121206/19693_1 /TAXON_ID=223996 /ORGANISM="Protocruzia adherens, Strain Boccale" /LENGTH=230 /DNA_ID=CAMNT_0002371407 /DNA_START=126 /DNA_END=818 /DNA_ORIENTATION=-
MVSINQATSGVTNFFRSMVGLKPRPNPAELLRVISQGEVEPLAQYLDTHHVPHDYRVMGSNTLLFFAVTNNNIPMVEYLLSLGYSVNEVNNAQVTPLQLAVHLNFHEAAEILLKAGCCDDTLSKALLSAVYKNHRQMAELLMENGAVMPDHQNLTIYQKRYYECQTPAMKRFINRYHDYRKRLVLLHSKKFLQTQGREHLYWAVPSPDVDPVRVLTTLPNQFTREILDYV